MIEKVEMYQAVCDGCGRTEEQVFGSISKLTEVMIWRDWHFIGDKHYCHLCVEWDGETRRYKPKEIKEE